MDELKTVNCEQLMTTPLKPIEFCVDGMISSGLFILAGAPKAGKSWLALDIALSIAKGEKVLGRDTKSGSALYLCLEDSYTRIQNRLFELTSEPSEEGDTPSVIPDTVSPSFCILYVALIECFTISSSIHVRSSYSLGRPFFKYSESTLLMTSYFVPL